MQCQICEQQQAAILCDSCKTICFYCKSCFSFKHKTDILRAHKSHAIEGSDLAALKGAFCSEHPSERAKFLCKKCNYSVCSDCLLIGSHKGHSAVSFEDALREIIEENKAKIGSTPFPKDAIALINKELEEMYANEEKHAKDICGAVK